MTAALEGGELSALRPGRTLPPGKTRYPLYSRLGGPQGRSGGAKNLVLTGIRSRTDKMRALFKSKVEQIEIAYNNSESKKFYQEVSNTVQ